MTPFAMRKAAAVLMAASAHLTTIAVLYLAHKNAADDVHYSLPRSMHWFEATVMNEWVKLDPYRRDKQFIKAFRVNYSTFNFLCDKLKPHIERQKTNAKEPWSVETRVGVALYRLGHGASYAQLSHKFGVAESTANGICREIYDVLWSMSPEYITWGSDLAKQSTMRSFSIHGDLPGCLGAIDGCHIPIECPAHSLSAYRNRKGWHSIVLSAIVDFDRRFVDVDIGMPSRNHDAYIFKSSKIHGVAKGHFGINKPKRLRRGRVDVKAVVGANQDGFGINTQTVQRDNAGHEQPQASEPPLGHQELRDMKRQGETQRDRLCAYVATSMPEGWVPRTWRQAP